MKHLLTCIFLMLMYTSQAQVVDGGQLQAVVKAVIKKACAASVRIWGFDTVRHMQNSSQFSGVVVSREGTILTVSHAITPNRTYKVLFPDGREVMAVALGRIGFADMQNRPDLGMMKIITAGTWPAAEMGWSYSVKENEPCISIAYPETLNQLQPTVRFGKITHTLNEWGFMQSTCKMEPGDSGGPLFDYMGRVIGIHSRIEDSEDENYEVPVDLYRKYRTALNIPENYKTLPQDTDVYKPVPDNSVPVMSSSPATPSVPTCVCTIHSRLNDTSQTTLGTVFHLNEKTVVICKASLIHGKVSIAHKNKQLPVTVMAIDTANDLALLSVNGHLSNALPATALNETIGLNREDLGTLLISALPVSHRLSIVSSTYFHLPRKFSGGYLGASANSRNGKIILGRISPNSPASQAGLQQGDRIVTINGVPIVQPEQYGGELSKYDPGENIVMQLERNDSLLQIKLSLTQRPVQDHAANRFKGGKSIRLDGFKEVFSHDAALQPQECGGPVFDFQGRFYGINIARFSRTSTLVMPVKQIRAFIETQLKIL